MCACLQHLSRLRIAGCAVAVPLSLPPSSPVLVALFDGSLSPGVRLQRPTISRSPSLRSLQVFAYADSALSWIVAGMPYGVSPLSGPPSSLGWLPSFGFPEAGVRMLAAPVTHRVSPAGRNHALLQVQPAPSGKQSRLVSSGWWFSRARWAWNVAGVRCGCTLRLRFFPGFGCLVCGSLISGVLDLQHSQSSRVPPEGCTGVWSPCRLQPCCLLLAGGACCPLVTCCRKCRYSAAVL